MNLLFIIHHVAGGGGPALQARKMAQVFEKLGHQVYLVTMRRETSIELDQRNTLTYKLYYASTNPLFYNPPLANIFLYKKCQKILQKFDVDVSQSFDTVISGPVGVKIFSKHQIPSAIRIGTVGKKHYEYLLKSGRRGGAIGKFTHQTGISPWILNRLEQITLQGLGILLPNSNYLAEQYLSVLGKRKVRVIRTGVDLSVFRPIPEKDNPVLKQLQPDGFNVVTYIGRIEERKGLHIFLRSLKNVLAEHKQTKVLIIGSMKTDRNYYEFLVRLAQKLAIRNHISFLGEIPHHHVPFYISLSDVLVLPSHLDWMEPIEGLPNIVLETMACKKPIIATPVCGIPEIIKNAQTGFLCKSGDVQQLGEQINLVISNHDLAKKVGNNARNYIEKHHDLMNVAEEYLNVYNVLIQ